LLQRATFGVSLERAGGSTTGRPSPGALHAKLLPVAN
jgi:anti-sigma-K factor RskA